MRSMRLPASLRVAEFPHVVGDVAEAQIGDRLRLAQDVVIDERPSSSSIS